MAEAELDVADFTPAELLAAAAGLASALRGNEHFPAPEPSPDELDQMAEELSRAEEAYREKRQVAEGARAARDEVAERLRRALRQEVAYVQEASGGEVEKILSANLHVEETTSFWPFTGMRQVAELTASAGDQPGEIDLAWDAVPHAKGYELEMATDLLGERWDQCGAAVNSKTTLNELAPKARYWSRVRAIGERGTGEWSEPVMKFAPG